MDMLKGALYLWEGREYDFLVSGQLSQLPGILPGNLVKDKRSWSL